MSWGNDHDHRGDYAEPSHNHDSYDVYGVASEHHSHHDYASSGHDHDQGEIWSAITDLQNSVEDLKQRVATLAALAADRASHE